METAKLRAAGCSDEVLFTGEDAEVRAWCEATFGPGAEPDLVLRTPEDLDAYLGTDACEPSR
jgi:hypothetical protein